MDGIAKLVAGQMPIKIALLAQLVEQVPLKDKVAGPSPARGTRYKNEIKKGLFFYFTSGIIKKQTC